MLAPVSVFWFYHKYCRLLLCSTFYHWLLLLPNLQAWKASMGTKWKKLSEITELKGSLGAAAGTVPAGTASCSSSSSTGAGPAKRKRNKKKTGWVQATEHSNIYVQGLPLDVTMDEMVLFFKKAGIIKSDPFTGVTKIKCYKDKQGKLKGDGSISYLKVESSQTK